MNPPLLNNTAPRLHVELDRHFHEFTKEELAEPELLAAYNEEYAWTASLSWGELLKRKRVVMLASAGSGKTEELRETQRRLLAENKFAFYVRLEELAQQDFTTLLMPDEQRHFEKWRMVASATAWFFLDAVDELKL